jgi:hypothetical protein
VAKGAGGIEASSAVSRLVHRNHGYQDRRRSEYEPHADLARPLGECARVGREVQLQLLQL